MTESDRDAASRLEFLLGRYAGLLRSAIHRHCPRDLGISAADIEQEARVRLWRALEREKEIADPASYIYRIAVTATIDAVRRARSRREDQLSEGPDENREESREERQFPDDARDRPDARMERRELMARLARALQALSADRRRAVELHLQGLTLSEIAELLSWSEARTRNLVYRGMDDLRGALRREGIEYE